MAKETDLEMFIGVDHAFRFPILNVAETAAYDITGWSLSWMLKRKKSFADAAASVTKTVGSGITITGLYDADPAVNTQCAVVAIEDVDTDALSPGIYYHELKRTNAGLEDVMSFGEFELKRGVHRS